jgi:hypothetical protein
MTKLTDPAGAFQASGGSKVIFLARAYTIFITLLLIFKVNPQRNPAAFPARLTKRITSA